MRMMKIGLIVLLLFQATLFYLYLDLKTRHEDLLFRVARVYFNNILLQEKASKIDNLKPNSDHIIKEFEESE
ncbi:MAG: hypothetical protein ACRCZ9_02670 [Fusobacteriaceae bacterium]